MMDTFVRQKDSVNVILDRMDALASLLAGYGRGQEDTKEQIATVLDVFGDVLTEQVGKVRQLLNQ